MNGRRCTTCGMTDKDCLAGIHSGGRGACCSRCTYTDTHKGVADDRDVPEVDSVDDQLVQENIALRAENEELKKAIRLAQRAFSKVRV